ncbi:hypothetical protein ABZP36_003769 [Zizania latifolia]
MSADGYVAADEATMVAVVVVLDRVGNAPAFEAVLVGAEASEWVLVWSTKRSKGLHHARQLHVVETSGAS